ncbi:MAG: carbohydrate kinase [Clostridia bacterium]
MKKLICMGECLVDMLPSEGELSFQAKAGGAPANVCACVSKLGGDAHYLGKMADDLFGRFLFDNLTKYGVKTDLIKIDKFSKTGLAFVALNKDGEREFSFYRDMTADMLLDKDEISDSIFEKDDILHFCSVALMPSPTCDAHKKAITDAIKKGAKISFDVNVRLPLWKSVRDLRRAISAFLPYADILKVSDDELEFITDIKDENDAINSLYASFSKIKLVFVTKGKNGVSVYSKDGDSYFEKAVDVTAVDTTGAGDCFIGCALFKILENNGQWNFEFIKNIISFATNGAAIVVTKKGAMEAMPTLEEIENAKL